MAWPGMRKALGILLVPLVSSAILSPTPKANGLSSITPGTPAQVAALVAAAPAITTLPSPLVPSLIDADSDDVFNYYPSLTNCALSAEGGTTVPTCVYGDTTATKSIVLWGDSHAYMWFPAVDHIARQDGYKLVALFKVACPVADLNVLDVLTGANYPACSAFRNNMIARINKLDPSMVIMSEDFYSLGYNKKRITTSAWTRALEATIKKLRPNIQKVLLGNTIPVGYDFPSSCLASNTTNVQKCSVPEHNSGLAGERNAEKKAIAAEQNSTYIDVIAFTCSTVCTDVIGSYVVYYANQHLTATYDYYLSGVLGADLQPLL
jgi:hypothetical protein